MSNRFSIRFILAVSRRNWKYNFLYDVVIARKSVK